MIEKGQRRNSQPAPRGKADANSSVRQTEATLVAVLSQLIVIVLVASLAGNAAVAIRQPRTIGEIIAGLMLGPSFFGALFPDVSASLFTEATAAPTLVLSQIGLILLMFQIGSDFEFAHLKGAANQRAVLLVTAFSVAAPLAAGFAFGWFSAPRLAPDISALPYSPFVSIAFAITAVLILARILREYQMTRTLTGVIAISATAGNDVIGWLPLASVAAFTSAGELTAASAAQIAGLAALIELIVLNIGLSLGFIPQDMFTMLVIMAIGTTVMTGPLL